MRTDKISLREMSKNCFYPIIVENGKVIGFGEVLESNKHPEKSAVEKNGKLYIWPIDGKNIERKWGYARQSVEEIKDFMRARRTENRYKIEFSKDFETYKTVWDSKKYDASSYGTKLLKDLIPSIKLAADEKDSRFKKFKNANSDTNETSIEFSFPKSLWNVYDCLYAIVGNDKNAIILDFFGGSGTTAHAVLELNKEDDGNRKFIICEQMDYVETVTRERIRKVCENNQNGSFIYCELAKFNQVFIDQIQNAKNTQELWKIWEQMKKTAFLSYQLDPKNIDNTKSDFEKLSFVDQQKFLISLLDKNLLYIPYCDIEDKSYGISEEVKKLNWKFYEKG